PKFRQIDLACPRWRYPFGSGGNRVTVPSCLPEARSSSMISRIKSFEVGAGSSLIVKSQSGTLICFQKIQMEIEAQIETDPAPESNFDGDLEPLLQVIEDSPDIRTFALRRIDLM